MGTARSQPWREGVLENNAPPLLPPAQSKGAIVRLVRTTGQTLNSLSWRLCLRVGAEGWLLAPQAHLLPSAHPGPHLL